QAAGTASSSSANTVTSPAISSAPGARGSPPIAVIRSASAPPRVSSKTASAAIASTGAARAAYTRRACRCATDRPAKPPGNHVASRAANPAGDAAEDKAEDPVPNPAEDPVEGTMARKDLLPPACADGTVRGDRVRRCQ